MSASTAVVSAPVPRARPVTNPEIAIARRAFTQLRVSAISWAVVFGATIAASALTYVKSFPDQASRDQLAATTSHDTGLAVLLGPVSAIDTVGGYTVYKCFVFLTVIGAIWGMLAATRLLRGEEDAGRWQLVLAAGTRAARATAATLAALGAAVLVVFVGTLVFTLLAGRNPDVGFGLDDSVFYALSIIIAPAVFVGVGAVTSQLGRTRRVATGLGMIVFGVATLLRMVADSGPSTRWLLWFTPFGWTERMRPFTEHDARPLALAVLSVLVLVVAATTLSARRDAGSGIFASRDAAPLRSFGLGSTSGLARRLELPVLVAWWIGVVATALFLGVIAKLTTESVPESVTDMLDKFGVSGAFLDQYLGVAFLLVATVVGLLPASQIGAAAEEETTGRIVHVLTRPVRRAALLGERLALAAGSVVVAGFLAGLGAWVGASSQGVDPGLRTMVRAGLNVVPTALVVLGIGAIVLATAPRFAARSVYAVVIWSLVIDLFASLIEGLDWLQRLSLFHYMALAPAQPVEASTIVITTVIAIALCVTATLLFERRDIQAR